MKTWYSCGLARIEEDFNGCYKLKRFNTPLVGMIKRVFVKTGRKKIKRTHRNCQTT
jgi:hypothetical protein